LIDRLYRNERPEDLIPEEEIIADLISHDKAENSGLQSFIRNMFAIIEFDAYRKGWPVGLEELVWYSDSLAKSVTDGIQYFIGNGYAYPDVDSRYSAAIGAHIAHLLRDTLPDTADGFINISAEYLEEHDIRPEDVDSDPYRAWVRERVEEARQYFLEGKRYLDELDILRCKIVGHWYCARFEAVLDTIESDNYHLRADYEERRKLSTWLKIGWLGVVITFRHITRRDRHHQ
jgi:phytoene/squalene synthetase